MLFRWSHSLVSALPACAPVDRDGSLYRTEPEPQTKPMPNITKRTRQSVPCGIHGENGFYTPKYMLAANTSWIWADEILQPHLRSGPAAMMGDVAVWPLLLSLTRLHMMLLAFARVCSLAVSADACNPSPCENGGSCALDPGGGHICTCAAGFGGMSCQTDTTGEFLRQALMVACGSPRLCTGPRKLGRSLASILSSLRVLSVVGAVFNSPLFPLLTPPPVLHASCPWNRRSQRVLHLALILRG